LESGRHTIGRMVELAQRPVGEGTLATTAALAESMGALMRPSLNILGDELTGRIVDEAKRVLAEVGMEIRGPEMRRRLVEHGLPTNATGERVLFPRDVVEAAIASAPSSFTLFDRDGLPHADLGGDRVHFVPGSSGLKVLDHRTGETRLANSTDFVEYVRLADGLEHIAYLATAFSTNLDIEAQVSDAWRLYMTLTNSKKPVVSGAFTEHGVPRMVEMMQLFRADRADLIARPMSIFTITATGNFRYSEDSCQNMIDCVEAGIPVEIVPVTLMGLIAPVTIVGATVFHTVDVLAGITMAQVIKPGAPVLFGGAPATFHMKIASAPMAAIEALRLDVAYIAVAKALGLPCQSYMALSDGKILDAQAGAETFGSALLAALAGVNSVSGPGMLDFLLVFSLPKLVFDDEMCAQALQFVREVQPAEDLPVSALIDQLMADQHLIMAEHTMAHWPSELYLPSAIVDRDNREAWLRLGGKDTYQRACDEVERRLASYRQPATDPAIDAELRSIIQAGLSDQTDLPLIPPAPEPAEVAPSGAAARRQNPRRQRISQEGPPR
jgi:trimethylamine---corrinoid protein Co-methyltransferase